MLLFDFMKRGTALDVMLLKSEMTQDIFAFSIAQDFVGGLLRANHFLDDVIMTWMVCSVKILGLISPIF